MRRFRYLFLNVPRDNPENPFVYWGQKPPHMSFRLLIFDFDGTIANTLEVAVEIVNELGAEFGFPEVNQTQLIEFKNKSVAELLKLSGLSWMQLPLFVKRARDRFKHHLAQVHPIEGMEEVLRALHAQGYQLGILTSNTEDSVKEFLDRYDLNHFEFIYAPDSLFGKSKVIKDVLKQFHLKRSEVVMIGDEARDIEAAVKAKVQSVAVTWGFNGEEILNECQPTYVVRKPAELLEVIKAHGPHHA